MSKILNPLIVFTNEETHAAWDMLGPIMFRIAAFETKEQRRNFFNAFYNDPDGKVDIDNLVSNYNAVEKFKNQVAERFWDLFEGEIECYFDEAVRNVIESMIEDSNLDNNTIRTVLSHDDNNYRSIDADISAAI